MTKDAVATVLASRIEPLGDGRMRLLSQLEESAAPVVPTRPGRAALPPPRHVVFHDSKLRGIAAARARTLGELAQVQGVGEAKLGRYGQAMLDTLRALEEIGP